MYRMDKLKPRKPSAKPKLAVVKEPVSAMRKGGSVKGLTAAQKAKLPKALQEAILKKRGKK